MKQGRISRKKKDFDTYICRNEVLLNEVKDGETQKNGIRLGMASTEITTYGEYKTKWRSGDPNHPGAYDLHESILTRTRQSRIDTDKIMKDFRLYFQPILIRISSSLNITTEFRLALGIAEPVTTHSMTFPQIEDDCFAKLVPMGGGDVKFICSTKQDSSRPSKAENADAVEVAYRIDKPIAEDDKGENEGANSLKFYALSGPDDGTSKTSRSKASFILKLGVENAGLYLQVFVRWINTKHPEIAGHWKGVFTVFIG
jgi:hypothetical protein